MLGDFFVIVRVFEVAAAIFGRAIDRHGVGQAHLALDAPVPELAGISVFKVTGFAVGNFTLDQRVFAQEVTTNTSDEPAVDEPFRVAVVIHLYIGPASLSVERE